MEYIIISTFATGLSVAAVVYLGKIFHEKVRQLSEQLGVEGDEAVIDGF